jgi:hypothetical protein
VLRWPMSKGLLDGGDSRGRRLGAASNLSGKQAALKLFRADQCTPRKSQFGIGFVPAG